MNPLLCPSTQPSPPKHPSRLRSWADSVFLSVHKVCGNSPSSLGLLLIAVAVFMCSGTAIGQIVVSGTSAVTENFDGMNTAANASLPANWKMTAAGGGLTAGWETGSNVSNTTQAASAGTPSAGGRYNWGNGTTASDRSIGFMTSESYASPNAVMARYINSTGADIRELNISFDIERYRMNSAAANVTFWWSSNGNNWIAATSGDTGPFSTGTSFYDFTNGTVVSRRCHLSYLYIPNGSQFYLKWSFNTINSTSQGLGIDNVSVTAGALTFGDLKYNATNTDVTITGYTGPGGNLTIPNTINGLPVTGIGSNAFQYNPNLTSVTIPNSVAAIGDQAFYGCSNLTSLTIGSAINSIKWDTFVGCNNLVNLTIGAGASSISIYYQTGRHFASVTSLTFSEGVTTIGGTLSGFGNLTDIFLPASVSEIVDGVFFECYSLSSISVDSKNANFYSVAGVLFDRNQTLLIAYPRDRPGVEYSIPNGVTDFKWGNFREVSRLQTLILPNSFTQIRDGAFELCGSIRVTLPDSITRIGSYAFSRSGGLSDPIIPNSVTTIGDGAFQYCGMTSVTIPEGVTRIGAWAFYSCWSLATVSIPNSVTSIGEQAFQSCSSLTSVVIPNSVTRIEGYAFSGCGLTSVIIPANVTFIGEDAFACSYLYRINFLGNAPQCQNFLGRGSPATVYYLPGTTGWDATYYGLPTAVALTFIQQPSNTNAYQGRRVVFTVATSGSGVTYQWKKDGVDLTNATSATLVLDNVQAEDAASYTVVISNLEGSITSNEANLTVYPDADGDGLSDAQEVSVGSNPNDRDTDKDGVEDGLEVNTYQSNPLLKDSDSDGYEDGFEISTGFSPTSASSTPQAVSVIYPAVEFVFSADVGVTYHIQQSIDLQNWVTIESNIVGQGRVETRFYPTKNQPKRYFRVWRN